MPTVGLTGDVGAGKSTLCKEWAAMGAHIIDADSVARALWDDPSVFPPRGVCRDRP
ncbi:dephospho-CoA kinase, partial [Cloacibacillus evryensis]|nr:dephospho-CoA kinase [Cloacibacillus evryensis]